MNDYLKMCSAANTMRAYRWINTNSDARYKNLFRDSYAAFAISSGRNLSRLKQSLVRHAYEPSHASKVYLPKPSGVLRPFTLLTTNDQIVYQSCVNIIAEKLKTITKQRYRKRVFNHLYAGKSSRYFYLKWQDSYRMFSDDVRHLHNSGYVWVANFDLTSFYDSIDHNVLRHFLRELKIDEDLIQFLLRCLKVWTSSTWSNQSNTIYHEHGIPQGPQASGMLSEVVLQHLDAVGEKGRRTHYRRYVDDIKVFAKKENFLRQKLIALDLASKEIGLFPQTSKINIRKVLDPEDEIKSVSIPPEPSLSGFLNQAKLKKRILELTRRGTVSAELNTRFKYLLGHAEPNYEISNRVVKLIERHPENCEVICNYLRKFSKLPKKTAQYVFQYINGEEHYHFVHGSLILSVIDNIQAPERQKISQFCYDRLFKTKTPRKWMLPPQTTYKSALISWVLRENLINFSELVTLRNDEVDWWVRKSILRELTVDHYGKPSVETFLNQCLHLSESEVSRCAAASIIKNRMKVVSPYGAATIEAKECLKSAGLIRSIGRPPSLVGTVLKYVLGVASENYDWKKLLGPNLHRDAEALAVTIKQGFEVDIDSFLVRLDSLFDLIFAEVGKRINPGFTYTNYGVPLNSPPRALRTGIPDVLAGFKALHDTRISSSTAHPRSRRIGVSTRRLKHSDFYRIRAQIVAGIDEIMANITP